jgi:hypothetical protein
MVKKNAKNLFLLFVTATLVVFSSYAKYGGGTGTSEDPYLIYTPEDLNEIGKPGNEDDLSKHFALMADIDLSTYNGVQFNIIGKQAENYYESFSGVFDGKGHTISNFDYDFSDSNDSFTTVGIFGIVRGENALIKNLGLINPNILGEIETGPVAAVLEYGRIENCWVQGGKAESFVLGNCGGLVGENNFGEIANCYTEDVTVLSFFVNFGAGGLVGENNWGTIINCYAAGNVTSTNGYEGAFVGADFNSVYVSCFYDSDISGSVTGIGNITDPPTVIGKTTSEMKNSLTFIDVDWDMVTQDYYSSSYIWRMCADGVDYPRLNVEYTSGDFLCPDGIDYLDLIALAEEWQIEKFDIDVDFHFDKKIDFLDWSKLASAWQSTTDQPNYDQKYDLSPPSGIIDEKDIEVFVQYWQKDGSVYLNTDIAPAAPDNLIDFLDYAEFSKNWQEN